MDSVTSKRLIAELSGKVVGGWQIEETLGPPGKSAVVFKASRDGVDGALKVFDPDLVERFGRDVQLKRIDRELSLKEQSHPNLVHILDGGVCPETGHLFLVMQRLDAPNLAEVLKDVPREAIRPIIAQVADAARFLESLTPPIAHRDIKPDNIAISRDFTTATLLDLGVLLPIYLAESPPSSDPDRRFFVGTLMYGPPEFLVRTEGYSVDAWRAITFYQLGAVLYDLIMRERIFAKSAEPYPRLVMAVEHDTPEIIAKDVPEELILLAKNCLSKDPLIRLRYVSWDDFAIKEGVSLAAIAKERVRRRLAQRQETTTEDELARDEQARSKLRSAQELQARLHTLIKMVCTESDILPVECKEIPGRQAGQAFVGLFIRESNKLLLSTGVAVWFLISVIDEKSLVTEIAYSAALCRELPSIEAAENAPKTKLFAGAFQEGVVKSEITDLLFQLLDKAQGTALEKILPDGPNWFVETNDE